MMLSPLLLKIILLNILLLSLDQDANFSSFIAYLAAQKHILQEKFNIFFCLFMPLDIELKLCQN